MFGPDVTVSLNIAAKQACDVPFMTAFCASLGETGLAERFVLELTEEAFFTAGRFQRDVLPRIRAIGARVSIDDFGVGYSSLSALADITADELKIDRSFITVIDKRPRSQIVLKAIESLGAALGMSVVAEGVETYEEVAYLLGATQIRCAQGYYFARPLLLDQIGQVEPRLSDHAILRRGAAPRSCGCQSAAAGVKGHRPRRPILSRWPNAAGTDWNDPAPSRDGFRRGLRGMIAPRSRRRPESSSGGSSPGQRRFRSPLPGYPHGPRRQGRR